MASGTPGRNDPCSCGSGRKFKHCCLEKHSAEDSARVRLRGAEGRVVHTLLDFALTTWGKTFIEHAWEDFWVYDDVPDDMPSTPEFDTMFVPWFVLGFVPDPESDEARDDWPTQPVGLHWLATSGSDVAGLDRAYIEIACRSPLSAFVVERVTKGRSLDLKDVLTGKRFHVLEQNGSQRLRSADLLFTRVITIEGSSIMFGASPFILPPIWHTRIIDWREQSFRKRLRTRETLQGFDIEIRDLYLDIAAELLDPTPPQLANTDGDPLALTTLTYELRTDLDDVFEKLAPLAKLRDEYHISDVTHDASGAVTSASLSWVKAGNRQHKAWDNTILGTLRLEQGHLVAEVNSARRTARLKREIAKRLGEAATLIDTTVVDPTQAIAERRLGRAVDAPHVGPVPDTPPAFQHVEEEMARRHWRAWLDTPVPALANKTPRQAARTAGGRERLEALLAQFERAVDDSPIPGAAHLAAIREQLGLTKPT